MRRVTGHPFSVLPGFLLLLPCLRYLVFVEVTVDHPWVQLAVMSALVGLLNFALDCVYRNSSPVCVVLLSSQPLQRLVELIQLPIALASDEITPW